MKREHLDRVTLPVQSLAPSEYLETCQIRDWTGRRMLSREPFRIKKRKWPGIGGNRQLSAIDFPRRLRRIQPQGDRRSHGGSTESHRHNDDVGNSDRFGCVHSNQYT